MNACTGHTAVVRTHSMAARLSVALLDSALDTVLYPITPAFAVVQLSIMHSTSRTEHTKLQSSTCTNSILSFGIPTNSTVYSTLVRTAKQLVTNVPPATSGELAFKKWTQNLRLLYVTPSILHTDTRLPCRTQVTHLNHAHHCVLACSRGTF